jgi:hypothetical protein
MVLIGSAAPPHSALAAWQFASHGMTQLPLFELQVGCCLHACMQDVHLCASRGTFFLSVHCAAACWAIFDEAVLLLLLYVCWCLCAGVYGFCLRTCSVICFASELAMFKLSTGQPSKQARMPTRTCLLCVLESKLCHTHPPSTYAGVECGRTTRS